MARKLTPKKVEQKETYVPPPERWYFYIGEKYYRRLQPIPYKQDKIPDYIKKINEAKDS